MAGDVGAGHVLGRYELLMPIASGGMAMVWAARMKGTRGFQKIVAVKTMLPKLSEDAAFEQMFLDEASLASQVRHPHVVEILDLGEQEGVLYLVMEWLDGVPLNQLMRAAKKNGGVPLPVGVRVVMQACAGMHAAHELRDPKGQLVGLVHRDISPQNVLVTFDGVAKVLDFGIAKATAIGDGATAAGQIKGKVAYMAPEQIKGGTIDRRIDVFALGVVLYALTTGRHPFRKDSEAATLYNICSPEPAMPPRKFVPGYPATLERVVLQALAKDPAKRFPTANDLLRALDQALPSSMRLSTDEDIAAFVRSLMSERQEQSRERLRAAIEAADQRTLSTRQSLRALLDSQPPPGSGTVTPSGVEHSIPGAPSVPRGALTSDLELVPVSQTHPTLSSANAGVLVSAELEAPKKKKSRAGLVVVLALLAAGVVAGGIAVLRARTTLVAQPADPPQPVEQALPVAEAPAPTAAKEEATPESPETEPAAPEPSAPAASSPPIKRPTAARPKPAPRPTASAPAPTAPTKPKSTWKHDPGF